MSSIFTFPSPFVYSTQVNNHQQIKQLVLPKILQLAEEKQNDPSFERTDRPSGGPLHSLLHDRYWSTVITNFTEATSNLNFLETSQYIDIIWTPLDNMFNILSSDEYCIDYSKYQPKETTIKQIWWNVYKKGAYAPIHTHSAGAGLFSGVYILSADEPNNTIFSMDHTHSITTTEDFIHTTEYLTEGSVMIFPSSLTHHTLPCLEDRVVISFNLETEYTLNAEDHTTQYN